MNPQILLITLSGILIVFSTPVLLVLVLSIFGKVMSSLLNKDKAPKKQAPTPPSKPSVQPKAPVQVAQNVEQGIPDAVVAAIAAAVYSIGNDDGKSYVIRSVKRERGARPAWASAGIAENTRPF